LSKTHAGARAHTHARHHIVLITGLRRVDNICLSSQRRHAPHIFIRNHLQHFLVVTVGIFLSVTSSRPISKANLETDLQGRFRGFKQKRHV